MKENLLFYKILEGATGELCDTYEETMSGIYGDAESTEDAQ